MEAANWFTIKENVMISTAIETWKLVNKKKPMRLLTRMEITEDRKLLIQVPRLQFSTRCYRRRAAELWNGLGDELRNEKSIARFKRAIKIHVKELRHREQVEPD